MYILNIYIEGVRLELFEDENISLNQSIQNIKDISQVFTDFTQSFTVPTSTINNPIFEHWYNADIDDGFNAKVRKDAALELNYMPFKTGKMELNGAKLKNGIPHAYNITFYGDLLNLTDLFGDDKLSDLDLSAYDHEFTSANVLTGITTGLSFVGGEQQGSVIYPMISSNRNWVWDAQTTSLADDDVKYPGSGTTGITFTEFKPAIKINRIIEAIETDYGITFYGDFFKVENNHIDNLYLWLNKEKGEMQAYSDEVLVFENINYLGALLAFNIFYLNILPEAGYETIEYRLRLERTANGETTDSFYTLTGDTPDDDPGPLTGWRIVDDPGGVYNIYISSILEFSFTASYRVTEQGLSGFKGVTTITNGNTDISVNMPDIKLTDFISGLIKMFNLVIEPITSTTFNMKPLDEWYLDGAARDITQYVDITTIDIDKPKLWKRIDFSYVETDTILGEQFRILNDRGYGDLEAEFVYDGGILDIDVPFENVLQERLSSQLNNDFSDLHVGKIIDKDLESVEIAPYLFYNRNVVNLTDGFAFIDEAEVITEVNTYLSTGQEDELINGDVTQSLNFGEDLSSWTNQVPPVNPNSEGGLRVSLYSNYWEDYITDLYDNKRREYKFKAIFPLAVAQAIRLNNILKIRDRIYTINNMNTNLTTGEVNLDLLNYIGVVPAAIEGEAFGFDYELDFAIN